MSELRDRLAAKARRRSIVSVALEDATGAIEAVRLIEREILMARTVKVSDAERADQDERLAAAKAAVAGKYLDVEFQACSPVEFEAVQNSYSKPDGGIDGDKLRENLPDLLALCAVEDDLQDETFWREQIASGAWSFGEIVHLANKLITLNTNTPDSRIPFG